MEIWKRHSVFSFKFARVFLFFVLLLLLLLQIRLLGVTWDTQSSPI